MKTENSAHAVEVGVTHLTRENIWGGTAPVCPGNRGAEGGRIEVGWSMGRGVLSPANQEAGRAS